MTESSWAQEATDRFFSGRKSPSRMQCDKIAQVVFSASAVRLVHSPGSMSHTVVCSGCPGSQDLIVSFRSANSMPDEAIVRLAREIHGDLVPESTCHGMLEGADPPLFIYSMPYLRGSACIEVLSAEVEIDLDDETKHETFVKDLAQYFARCWSSSLSVHRQPHASQQEKIRKRLLQLAHDPISAILPESQISDLIKILPSLFSQDYPQVLTHGDFLVTNILLDETQFGITGIVDWSMASFLPFGMDLDILCLTAGFMTMNGWHDYACKLRLLRIFWEEFWTFTNIEGNETQSKIRNLAESAGQIGAILRLAFGRNADGSPSEEITESEDRMRQLRAWFKEQDSQFGRSSV